jgi:ABC-2 type transport system permease protein
MAVYKRTYKVYTGALTPEWSRFMVLTRYSLSTLFNSRLFTAYAVACLIPVLGGIGFIYLVHSQTAQFLLNMRLTGLGKIDNVWFAVLLRIQAAFGFIMMAWAAPGLINQDFANQALQLYFSRPLSRTEYMLGKFSVLAILLSSITWVPLLLLFGFQAQMEGNGWGWNNLYLIGSILVSGWLWISVISLVGLALAVSVRWRIAATALIVGVFFLLPGFGLALNGILRTHWGRLADVSYSLMVTWGHLFRIEPKSLHALRLDAVPLWSAWASVLSACLISLLLLNRRLKAREVER